ncbi:uncharacterized protein LOC120275782 [Dioscorea cayenensis subsp. rotundata]|uniref:Uncharacterized protein LOC120275782 n=1 Tax=Dioscorea cayennensis subsp. rotundata TaxID=55577 RepID=A0AB40CG81_DIOCR|nr:uncharacterized protein LOC120275782 [Dioscorea cayenensis subsp. rotundata]
MRSLLIWEIVDWEEDEDILVDEFAEDDNFLDEENNFQLKDDFQNIDLISDQDITDQLDPLREEKAVEELREVEKSTEVAPSFPAPSVLHSTSIEEAGRWSDKTKKPSGHWNEEAGFIPYPLDQQRRKFLWIQEKGNLQWTGSFSKFFFFSFNFTSFFLINHKIDQAIIMVPESSMI